MSLGFYHFDPQVAAQSFTQWMYSSSELGFVFANPFPSGVTQLPRMLNDPWDKIVSTIPPVTYPINSLADVTNLWPFMLTGVTQMRILWTDGSVYTEAEARHKGNPELRGRLKWYGIQRKGGTRNYSLVYDNPKRDDWVSRAPDFRYGRFGKYYVESNLSMTMGMPVPVYNAVWAYDRKDRWPRGIRLQFTVGRGPQAQSHDIIVALPDMHQEPERVPAN